ncbi:zf-DHHC-domain-containing protein [Clavulina sp. PMI_390]|nr:zf-DHHC-domain-containing protein [Clavulina sp. PMI_390]
MTLLRYCSSLVFRCFKCLERSADAATGAVGPVFVAIALTLLTLGVLSFFGSIGTTLAYPLLTIPLCLLVATNLLGQYYLAITVPPGFISDSTAETLHEGSSIFWAKRAPHSGASWSERRLASDITKSPNHCRKCQIIRPERAHHCSVCKRCVLKYDHHCPVRINQCVGLRNERHFILFMTYLVIGSSAYVFLGWNLLWKAISWDDWDYPTPRTAYMMFYILSVAIGFSICIMLLWQLYLVSSGETTVENYDNGRYSKIAKSRGTTFINSFDLGRRRNLELVFNLGPGGFPWWTLLLPYKVPPYTDGWSWARQNGMTAHAGISIDDELTDDDGED